MEIALRLFQLDCSIAFFEVERSAYLWKDVNKETGNRLKKKIHKLALEATENKIKKDTVFTARLPHEDFQGFKKIAAENRIRYQTLLGYVIHAYTIGTLVDVSEVRKVLWKK